MTTRRVAAASSREVTAWAVEAVSASSAAEARAEELACSAWAGCGPCLGRPAPPSSLWVVAASDRSCGALLRWRRWHGLRCRRRRLGEDSGPYLDVRLLRDSEDLCRPLLCHPDDSNDVSPGSPGVHPAPPRGPRLGPRRITRHRATFPRAQSPSAPVPASSPGHGALPEDKVQAQRDRRQRCRADEDGGRKREEERPKVIPSDCPVRDQKGQEAVVAM
jgi:hypothetical protein